MNPKKQQCKILLNQIFRGNLRGATCRAEPTSEENVLKPPNVPTRRMNQLAQIT